MLFSDTAILTSDEHLPNTPKPIDVTLSGIVMLVSEEQYVNA